MARPLHYIQWSLPAWFVSLQSISHKAAVASLSHQLVTDMVASRPPAEREDVHHFSVRRRRGSTSRSVVHAVLSDQAPAR